MESKTVGIRTADPELMRQMNQAIILDLLRNNGALSRAQISRKLQLSKATVSRVVKQLLEDKIINEVGEGDSTSAGGRRPVMLKINKMQKYVIGIDLGTTNTVAAIGNLDGKLIEKISVPTPRNHSVKVITNQVSYLVENLIKKAGIDKKSIQGLGISEAGVVEKASGVIQFSPNFNWKNINIAEQLQEKTGLYVIADNCTRVMALGEIWHGKGQGVRNMLYVNIGYGVGSALVINNKVYNNHSEFGHITITNKKIQCGCGKYGCLEAVASGYAIERKANQIFDLKDKWLTAEDVAEKAKNGNTKAMEIFQETGYYLGKGISIIANVLNPDKIIIGGGVARAGKILLNPIRETFEQHTMENIKANIKIETSSLGTDAGVYGAITNVLNERVYFTSLLKKNSMNVS